MTAKAGFRELDEKANRALTRFYNRTGWEPVYVDLPFDEIIAAESDGEDSAPTEYDIHQRITGIKAFFRFLGAHGPHPAQMLKQMAACGRACHIEPWNKMTMHELGYFYGETAGAHSWRCKGISREISLSGMTGSKLPGQKSQAASESYRRHRKGNCNRKGGKKFLKRSKASNHDIKTD